MKKIVFIVFFATVLLYSTFVSPDVSCAALFQNGSFESGTNPKSSRAVFNEDTTTITGWSVGGDGVFYVGTMWVPSAGSRSMNLTGQDGMGTISQTFDTIANRDYEVIFDVAGSYQVATPQSMRVTVAGVTKDYTVNASESSILSWTKNQSFGFKSTGESTTIMFAATSGDDGPALDNVRVNYIPIPAEMWLFGSGIIGLVVVRRRFNR